MFLNIFGKLEFHLVKLCLSRFDSLQQRYGRLQNSLHFINHFHEWLMKKKFRRNDFQFSIDPD